MKQQNDLPNAIIETQKIYHLQAPDKDCFSIYQSNGIITEHKYYSGFQTVQKKKIIKQQQEMNLNIYLDILSDISNQINNKSANLKFCFLPNKEQQLNQKKFYSQLIYSITFQNGYQFKEKEIDQTILRISKQLELICLDVYNNGDQDLKKQIDELFDEFLDFFM
ncbi:unnamed protein product [Paramecium sonneborni]|uniref:Uncharacterized protein n=1 Tax=Paramecium sonneborni TaxID=65129 RepID=A0A8S1JYT1_9CILI|nr:unnamed protein product [Paramecium sonneborni]